MAASLQASLQESLQRTLVAQFHQPHGALGQVAGWIMSRRGSNVERNRWTVSLLHLQPADRVLEIGFGPGIAIEAAAAQTPDGLVVGVDHSEVMGRIAARRNRAAIARGGVALHRASADDLPHQERHPELQGPFDAIYTVNCLMFWEDADAVLARLVALLAPGGTIAVTHQPRNPGANAEDVARSASELRARFEATGLEAIRVEQLSLEPVNALCVLGERRC